MAAGTSHEGTHSPRTSEGATTEARQGPGRPVEARLTTEQIWRALAKASFAVLGYVTPSGEPRSSGVMYRAIGRRVYTVVGTESWKARHIAETGRVSVTVLVPRGGLLSLVAPIPPATISFHGAALVHPVGSPQVRALTKELKHMLPAERRDSACVIEIVPEGQFLTYAIGVPLSKMRDPTASRARASVS